MQSTSGPVVSMTTSVRFSASPILKEPSFRAVRTARSLTTTISAGYGPAAWTTVRKPSTPERSASRAPIPIKARRYSDGSPPSRCRRSRSCAQIGSAVQSRARGRRRRHHGGERLLGEGTVNDRFAHCKSDLDRTRMNVANAAVKNTVERARRGSPKEQFP